jgi:hypothetical protein
MVITRAGMVVSAISAFARFKDFLALDDSWWACPC